VDAGPQFAENNRARAKSESVFATETAYPFCRAQATQPAPASSQRSGAITDAQ